ncbi:hypothetical protein SDRG_13090 [Saprolegnia diclina VS20]|uniref:F-box domain-containing protein n=1 Tax=Saprolegnia diclina (strain VS20) TaxID=1156394 RepID=T0RHC4_SAPDV|nr:hypothetical protein SDRG_13090 [Saprolegnia diclina VS20]EQC29217.1 hypothetical protein SDRG_13090 [Saprolegnia diclina VS20]|eukprot:XP_008617395.1 hypothetical protein SDRG_13090 [Saprolegnia diclina VS20]
MTPSLTPDALEHVASFLETAESMDAFLIAMPETYLSTALLDLRHLATAVEWRCFWPRLRLPKETYKDSQLLCLVLSALRLYPQAGISVHGNQESNGLLPKLAWLGLHDMTLFQRCMTHAVDALTALEIRIDSTWTPAMFSRLQDAMRGLRRLRHLDVVCPHSPQSVDLIAALSISRATSVVVTCVAAAKWPTPLANGFLETLTRWLQASPLRHVHLVSLTLERADAATFAAFYDVLLQSPTITALTLQTCDVATYCPPRLHTSLPPKLTSLSAHSDSVVLAGAPRLQHLTSLRVLQPWACPFAALPMAVTIIASLRRLNALTLKNIALDANDIAALAPVLRRLERLVLDGNMVTTHGVATLATALEASHCLHLLRLTNQTFNSANVTEPSFKQLMVALPASLRVLDLRRNTLQDHHAIALATVLPSWWTLTVLDVSLNGIGSAGVDAIARALPHLSSLRRLNVSRNAYGTLTDAAVKRARLPTLSLQDRADLKNLQTRIPRSM